VLVTCDGGREQKAASEVMAMIEEASGGGWAPCATSLRLWFAFWSSCRLYLQPRPACL